MLYLKCPTCRKLLGNVQLTYERIFDQICKDEELKINNKDEIITKAKGLEQVKKWVGEGKIVKEIYVPGKMVNLVIQ